MNILNEIKKLNLPFGEYVVVGSGILDILNIRKANDVDILATSRLHEKLRNTGEWKESIKYNKIFLEKDMFEIIPELSLDNYKTPTEELIGSAIVVDNIPFMNLDELCKFKQSRGKEKDLEDIILVNNYLALK
ncbi:MAG: zinc ABC transporter substrate-binding protein [bacterium]